MIDYLQPHAELLSGRLDAPFDPTTTYLFERHEKIDTIREENWSRAHDWIHKNANLYVTVLHDTLRKAS